jgi:hypothetical protein
MEASVFVNPEDRQHAMTPANLADMVRQNHHLVSICLASAQQIRSRAKPIQPQAVKQTLDNWRLIALHLTHPLTSHTKTSLHLIGHHSGRRFVMTSDVHAIDTNGGLVRTSNSIYGITGQMSPGEPDSNELVHLCATLNGWGIGQVAGMPGWTA